MTKANMAALEDQYAHISNGSISPADDAVMRLIDG